MHFFLAQLALQGNRANGKKSLPSRVPGLKKGTKTKTAPELATHWHSYPHMYFIDANSMSIGSTLAQIFLGFRLEQLGSCRPLIRAVGLSSLAFSNRWPLLSLWKNIGNLLWWIMAWRGQQWMLRFMSFGWFCRRPSIPFSLTGAGLLVGL